MLDCLVDIQLHGLGKRYVLLPESRVLDLRGSQNLLQLVKPELRDTYFAICIYLSPWYFFFSQACSSRILSICSLLNLFLCSICSFRLLISASNFSKVIYFILISLPSLSFVAMNSRLFLRNTSYFCFKSSISAYKLSTSSLFLDYIVSIQDTSSLFLLKYSSLAAWISCSFDSSAVNLRLYLPASSSSTL